MQPRLGINSKILPVFQIKIVFHSSFLLNNYILTILFEHKLVTYCVENAMFLMNNALLHLKQRLMKHLKQFDFVGQASIFVGELSK